MKIWQKQNLRKSFGKFEEIYNPLRTNKLITPPKIKKITSTWGDSRIRSRQRVIIRPVTPRS